MTKKICFKQKYVQEIKDRFLIKEYQRGYRWTKIEIEDLLNDINGIEDDEKYCLQPLIIRKIDINNEKYYKSLNGIVETNDRTNDEYFDLINSYYRVWFYDGQYRLLKGANRDKYLDCQFIAKMDEKANGEKITFTFGSNSDRQMAEIGEKKIKIYYQGGKYYSSKGEKLLEEEIDEYLKCPSNGT